MVDSVDNMGDGDGICVVTEKNKQKKLVDDTEVPLYPCEECTKCFTTMADLKVIFMFLFYYGGTAAQIWICKK